MQTQNIRTASNQINFRRHITISRINNDPNSEAIKKALFKAVDSFAEKAEALGCPLFKGLYIDPETGAEKIIIATGNDYLYLRNKSHNKEELNEKIKKIDIPLLAEIKKIKQSLKTPSTKNACLIDSSDEVILESGGVLINQKAVGKESIEDTIEIGLKSKSSIKKLYQYTIYSFKKGKDREYISTQKRHSKSFIIN